MPQLELEFFTSQIFWCLACFLVLYVFFNRMIIPKIESMMSYRKDVLESNIAEADEISKYAIAFTESYGKKLSLIQGNTDKYKLSALKNYDIKLKKTLSDEIKRLDQKELLAMKEVENRVKKFYLTQEDYILLVAELIIKKISGNSVDKEILSNIVSQQLSDLQKLKI